MTDKLTPWFPASIRPSRNGVYEVRGHFSSANKYSLWDGLDWGSCDRDVDGANEPLGSSQLMEQPEAEWRGLAQDPKGGAK